MRRLPWLISGAVWLLAGFVLFASDAGDRAKDAAIFVSMSVALWAIYAARAARNS